MKTEKGRLENAVQEMNRVESVLREENAELKRKVNTLNLRVSSLRKKEFFLQSKHRKHVSELDTLHASTIAELQRAFKTSKSKEIASVISKLREQHEAEKRELRTSLEAAHAQEITALKKELTSAVTSLEQREHDIKQLKDELVLSQAEVKRYADKVTEGIAERDALVEVSSAHVPFSCRLTAMSHMQSPFRLSFPFQGIQTLSDCLEHMKRAEAELRAIRMEEIRQTYCSPSSPPETQATTISGATGDSTSLKVQEVSEVSGKAETGRAPVLKKERVQVDQEKPQEVLENIPEGVTHIRTNPFQPPPPTSINQHHHTGPASNASATGRAQSTRKAAAMRARRSYSANSPNT